MSLKKQFLKSKKVCKVTFTVPKELVQNAKAVKLVGEFNEWDVKEAYAMKALKNGSFKATIELPKGKDYEFRYLVDNNSWVNEVEADKFVSNPYGNENSVVCV